MYLACQLEVYMPKYMPKKVKKQYYMFKGVIFFNCFEKSLKV